MGGFLCREITSADFEPISGLVSSGSENVWLELDPKGKQQKYLIQNGDVLFSFRGTEGTLGQVGLYMADLSLHAKLSLVFTGEEPDVATVTPLLEEARLAGINLDGTNLGFLLKTTIERLAEQLFNNPDDCSCMEQLNNAAALARSVPFEVNLWRPQTLCFKIIHVHWPQHKSKADQGDAESSQWIRSATVLAENFSVQLP